MPCSVGMARREEGLKRRPAEHSKSTQARIVSSAIGSSTLNGLRLLWMVLGFFL
jgi:hypothetical protein